MSYNFKAIAADMAKAAAINSACCVDEKKATVENKQPSASQVSARACNAVRRSIITGILRSLANHIFGTFPDTIEQNKKFETVINAMLAAKDLDANEARWITRDYLTQLKSDSVASDPDCCEAPCTYAYLSWWMVMDNLMSDVNVYTWSFESDPYNNRDGFGTLSDQEKAIVEGYRTAQEAYYKARRAFEDYFREVNKRVLTQCLIKYATTFQQVDPEWYKAVSRSAGVVKSDGCCEACGEECADAPEPAINA